MLVVVRARGGCWRIAGAVGLVEGREDGLGRSASKVQLGRGGEIEGGD